MVNGDRRMFVRVVAAAIVAAFVFVTTVTTVISVGKYCLTSNGANTATLPDLHRQP
ncbi:MAG: hypothetical protein DHS20C21_21690 [Gemmatimonadota bacterium]|nr:MAG: hypothetical protein DHS20C21_21690 [Gemmatimonadota bacterium]